MHMKNYIRARKGDPTVRGPKHMMRVASANCKIGEGLMIKNVSKVFINNSLLSDRIVIRADLAEIRLESFCILGTGVVLHPSFADDMKSFVAIKIGKFNIIGSNTILKCTVIGNYNRIGRNCIIGEKVVIWREIWGFQFGVV